MNLKKENTNIRLPTTTYLRSSYRGPPSRSWIASNSCAFVSYLTEERQLICPDAERRKPTKRINQSISSAADSKQEVDLDCTQDRGLAGARTAVRAPNGMQPFGGGGADSLAGPAGHLTANSNSATATVNDDDLLISWIPKFFNLFALLCVNRRRAEPSAANK